METPLVSIIIPTHHRPELLYETLTHIEAQTYKNKEIIIVFDGLEETYFLAKGLWELEPDVRIVHLGRNWSGLDKTSFGIAPLLVGYLMARGVYVMPWCDDERALTSKHIEILVNAMQTPVGMYNNGEVAYPDFVYSQVHIWRNGAPKNHENTIIGKNPPEHGQITHYMFKPENFITYGYPDWGTHPVDWSLVDKWMRNGAAWLFIPEVTFEHRLDQ